MKNLFVLMILVFMLSCEKEEPELPIHNETYIGTSTCSINGDSFDFKPKMKGYRTIENKYSLVLFNFLYDNIFRKEISFSLLELVSGKQKLHNISYSNQEIVQCSFATFISDGDVVGNNYFLNETDSIEDYIELTKINKVTGEIEGIFQASFYIDTGYIADFSSPDTIIIKNGYFKTTIQLNVFYNKNK